jgi:hypothetical protein
MARMLPRRVPFPSDPHLARMPGGHHAADVHRVPGNPPLSSLFPSNGPKRHPIVTLSSTLDPSLATSSIEKSPSNTFMHAQTPSRFRQLSTPFFLIPAALDPPLDVVHDATTQLLDHVQPHAPTTMSNTHPSPAIKARLRPAPRSTPLFSTLPALTQKL